jgi:hypothetical protein
MKVDETHHNRRLGPVRRSRQPVRAEQAGAGCDRRLIQLRSTRLRMDGDRRQSRECRRKMLSSLRISYVQPLRVWQGCLGLEVVEVLSRGNEGSLNVVPRETS